MFIPGYIHCLVAVSANDITAARLGKAQRGPCLEMKTSLSPFKRETWSVCSLEAADLTFLPSYRKSCWLLKR